MVFGDETAVTTGLNDIFAANAVKRELVVTHFVGVEGQFAIRGKKAEIVIAAPLFLGTAAVIGIMVGTTVRGGRLVGTIGVSDFEAFVDTFLLRAGQFMILIRICLLYTSPSPRD